jgi:hypothetical protein
MQLGRKLAVALVSVALATTAVGGLLASPASAASRAPAVKVGGAWSLSWDWTSGNSGTGTITFVKKSHTFSVTAQSGTWTKSGRHLTFVFTSSNSCYGTWTGTYSKASQSYSGTMTKNTSYCSADSGTWSMSRT